MSGSSVCFAATTTMYIRNKRPEMEIALLIQNRECESKHTKLNIQDSELHMDGH